MSSITNSNRLQKLSRTSEMKKHSISEMTSKDTIKLPALNSIFHSVKHNDISFMTGRQAKKLRKDPETSNDLEFAAVHQNLNTMRQKHDNVHTERTKKQQKINLLKEELLKFKTLEDELLKNKTQGQTIVNNLNNNLEKIKYMYEEADMQKKVLLNMKDRHKYDKVIYDQIKYNYNKQLSFLKKQIKIIKEQQKGTIQEKDKTRKVYEKLLKYLKQEENNRNQHLNSIIKMIQQKRQVLQINQVRQSQIQQIAQRAMQDKDQNQKSWAKVLLAQKLLGKLLRDKMYREMEKFNTVETAFKNIKIATGVSDAAALTFKFLNKQTVYGQLLGKIAQNETKIEQLKKQSDELIKQHKLLEQQQKQLSQLRKKQTTNLRKQNKQLQEIQNKKKDIQLIKGKINIWLIRNLKKFQMFGQEITKDQSITSLKDIQTIFKQYLNLISKNLDKIQQNKQQIKIQNKLQNLNKQQLQKMTRIKINSKKRKNSLNNQTMGDYQQQQIHNLNQQEENIDQSRLQILKHNDKFMKQLKKKYQEIKRIKMESMSPKKKQKEPQKKPKIIQEQH